ncbi:hypothetical protein G6011_08693 [Alternaria panax]|uniref:Uncharacterized protein n=1 Tax=Alternaria panax TaxID=48097 RepID=A0AAD4I6B6_9PLEO|nr:hypothetical protein G6011_08693 [Alternaria panax]
MSHTSMIYKAMICQRGFYEISDGVQNEWEQWTKKVKLLKEFETSITSNKTGTNGYNSSLETSATEALEQHLRPMPVELQPWAWKNWVQWHALAVLLAELMLPALCATRSRFGVWVAVEAHHGAHAKDTEVATDFDYHCEQQYLNRDRDDVYCTDCG